MLIGPQNLLVLLIFNPSGFILASEARAKLPLALWRGRLYLKRIRSGQGAGRGALAQNHILAYYFTKAGPRDPNISTYY